ncbi:MAG: hypothetical protein WC628_07005 [Candidatus Omnitrophota bacterium]
MDKKILIDAITPLYNFYKENKHKISAVEALEVMWDIGEQLRKYIRNYKIKPHTLYRQIYGMAEGKENIVQKSYITREFQNRCFRIRKLFPDKAQVRKEYSRLRNFTAFREAMPFLDNPKYALKGEEKEDLLRMLNSNLKPNILLKRIRELQVQKINKKNPRTQRLHEVESIKQNFIALYNYVYSLINLKDYELVLNKTNNISPEVIRDLAKAASSLCQEGLKITEFVLPDNLDPVWENYYKDADYLINQKDAKKRRRFRRIVPPERIIKLVDMLYALTSKSAYDNFRG